MAPALWNSIAEALFGNAPDKTVSADAARARAQGIAPVVWLLGKTGAGKTALVSALTGDTRAAVGEGFAPCTRTAAFFDMPAEAPLLRFLDTRGLGEASYDASADIDWCEQQAHLLLVVMQVADPSQEAMLARVAAGAAATSRLAGDRCADRAAPSLSSWRSARGAISLHRRSGR